MGSNNAGSFLHVLKDYCAENKAVSALAILSGVGVSVLLVKKLRGKKKRVCGIDYPENTVILHAGRSKGAFVPSLGHFCVKLQTYLNVTKIPYEINYDAVTGPKSKIPWIEYNGMAMGDSQLIINFLNKEFNVDLNKELSKEQRAQAWAIQKWLEEFTYWLNVYTRWYICLDDTVDGGYADGFPKWILFMMKTFRGKIKEGLKTVGVARHSDQEVHDMLSFDLRQLSVILGDKQYLMGGESPTELDCAAFGQLAQIQWATPDSCPAKRLLKGELQNLIAYTDRIKTKFWPDWNKLITRTQE